MPLPANKRPRQGLKNALNNSSRPYGLGVEARFRASILPYTSQRFYEVGPSPFHERFWEECQHEPSTIYRWHRRKVEWIDYEYAERKLGIPRKSNWRGNISDGLVIDSPRIFHSIPSLRLVLHKEERREYSCVNFYRQNGYILGL